MSKLWNKSEILNQYIGSGIIMYKATLEGDFKTNNKEGKKIIEVFKYLENNIEVAIDTLPVLFSNDNVVTRTKAAAHCLALKVLISEAESILEEVSKDKKLGIFSFNAEMTLKFWKEKGQIVVYQK